MESRVSPHPVSTPTLTFLPSEIKLQIAKNLNQIDALSLSRTGKAMAQEALQRVYASVVVDAEYSQFSREYSPFYTYINSSYSLKRFFRSKSRKNVRLLHVISLPDSTNIYTAETYALMRAFFTDLWNLHEFTWEAENLTLDVLVLLPRREALEKLGLTITFADESFDNEPRPLFPNLRSLQLRPFSNSERLVGSLATLVGEKSKSGTGLNSFSIARYAVGRPVWMDATSLHSLHPERADSMQPQGETETNTLEVLCTSPPATQLCHLSELCLDSILVDENDAVLLTQTVALARVKKLQLKSIAEYGPAAENPANIGFLATLSPHLEDLTDLHLDFRETTRDTIAEFLKQVPRLSSLDLVVRMNEYKRNIGDEDQLYVNYRTAICGHRKLRKLAMEVRQEDWGGDRAMPTPEPMVLALTSLRQITSLRLPHIDMHTLDEFEHILGNLPNIQYFDTFGMNPGVSQRWGLDSEQPNVYEKWLRVGHFAASYQRCMRSVQYVRINECVVESVGGSMQPRDRIDRWFDERVRV